MIPLNLKLKRKLHRDIAYAQDLVVEELYNVFPKAVLHGGTAIWRCYKGNRFSEDIDIYINKDKEKIEKLFGNLQKKGFVIVKKRIKENSLYSVLNFNTASIRLEALFKSIKDFILKEYETSESFFLNVYTLSPEGLIREKIGTYIKRNKIRDLYDIFFLLRYVEEKKIIGYIKNLLKNLKKPEDEENLKTIIISGPIPDTKKILDYIKRWAK